MDTARGSERNCRVGTLLLLVAGLLMQVRCKSEKPSHDEKPVVQPTVSKSATSSNTIQADVAALLDPWAGVAGLRAHRRLVDSGASSVPALLNALSGLDFSEENHRLAAMSVTYALHEITGTDGWMVYRAGMHITAQEEEAYCKRIREAWLKWRESSAGRAFLRTRK